MPIQCVVVGTGWVAGEYIKAIQANEDTNLYGIASWSSDRARAALSGANEEARIFNLYEDVVNDPAVDAVVLCSTPDVRPEQAILAAQHGKHLVIEKPMAMTKEEMWKMAEAISKNPVC